MQVRSTHQAVDIHAHRRAHIRTDVFLLFSGLVNLALFLANAMAESISNDSCDEVSWENDRGQYAISNSCGQNGRDYVLEMW